MILRQIDTLPTLPTIATRLLSVTANEDSDASEVIDLVRADPALTAKVLSMCRKSANGVRSDAMTVDKAVVLLGFNAVRNAVLSLKVFEIFDEDEEEDEPSNGNGSSFHSLPNKARFDTREFWRHSLAVAVAAEKIAAAHPGNQDLSPSEAFVCGLLHDVGKLAMFHVLPKAYQRVIELVELNQGGIAEFERRIIGIDHHTAGKRLAEQWQLPFRLQDCIWLHGSPFEHLPKLDHRRMVGLISLADMIVRRKHIGYSGNFSFRENPNDLAVQIGLNPDLVTSATANLHDEVQRRCESMGLDDKPSREMYMQSIQRANEMLGQLNAILDRRSHKAGHQQKLLDTITGFHATARPGRSVQDLLGAVVQSATNLMGKGYYATIFQQRADEPWQLDQFGGDERMIRSKAIEPPHQWRNLATLDADHPTSMGLANVLPWISDEICDMCDVRNVRMLPLAGSWGTVALLLHDRPDSPTWTEMSPLTHTWGAAVAAALQHDGARRLGEELAEANRTLAEVHDQLLRHETMARLGEMAAGAAHEMNNPLAVICGRSQLLSMSLQPGSDDQQTAQTIVEQSHRLSDLITALSEYAAGPHANREQADISGLLHEAVRRVQSDEDKLTAPINLQVQGQIPQGLVDAKQVSSMLRALLANAVQSNPRSGVTIVARHESVENTVMIQVTDDGSGMDDHTLSHAFDPFFSAKSAGRRVGMGLPLARQLAHGHGGQIELRSIQGEGTIATLCLPLD